MKSLRDIVVILILASSVYLWAGSAAHAGGSTGNSSPAYDPFEGDAIGFVQIRELELEALQAEIEAAKAELQVARMEEFWLWFQLGVIVFISVPSGGATLAGAQTLGSFMAGEAGTIAATKGLEWVIGE